LKLPKLANSQSSVPSKTWLQVLSEYVAVIANYCATIKSLHAGYYQNVFC